MAGIYDRMHRYLHEVWQVGKSGLVVERDGDWSWGDWGENIDMGVLSNCWYYLALKAEKAFALQLGKTADAGDIGRMMYSIEKCFDTKFWTGSAYRSPGYKGETDDRAQAMAVVSGLASADKYPALVKVLKKEYHASPYMEKYVLEALFRMNEPAFALERIKQRYTKMMNYPEYTTLFEGWGIGPDGFGGGTSRERILAIMKDSHIGSYGVIGLIFYFGLFYLLVSSLPIELAGCAILAGDPFCKGVSSMIINRLPYARKEEEAKNKTVYSRMTSREYVFSIICAFLPLLWLPQPVYLLAGIFPVITWYFLTSFMKRKIQGYTGDCCGATFLLSELSFYMGFVIIYQTI